MYIKSSLFSPIRSDRYRQSTCVSPIQIKLIEYTPSVRIPGRAYTAAEIDDKGRHAL